MAEGKNVFTDLITSIIILIGGIILLVQGIFLYIYFLEVPSSHFDSLSRNRNRILKFSFNLGIALGGLGLAVVVLSAKDLIGKISKRLAGHILNLIILVIAVIAAAYIWYLIPGYIGVNELTDTQQKNIDLASSISLALLGFLAGAIVFNLVKEIFQVEEVETKNYGLAAEIAIVFVIVLIQSIAGIITYYYGNRSRNFLLVFIIGVVISIIAIVLAVVMVAI